MLSMLSIDGHNEARRSLNGGRALTLQATVLYSRPVTRTTLS